MILRYLLVPFVVVGTLEVLFRLAVWVAKSLSDGNERTS